MKVRHQPSKDEPREVSISCEPTGLGRYLFVVQMDKGRGGETEPVIRTWMTGRELRDFAVECLGLVALEENRV